MSEWISIEDQIPDEHEPVIISGWNFNDKEKGRYVEPAVRVGMDFWPPFERDEGFIKILLMEGEPFHQPIHWMPLPAAPGDTAQPAAERPVQAAPEPIKLSDDVREYLQEGINSATQGEDDDHDFANQLCVLLGPIYTAPDATEQPYSTTSDRYRAELYDEVWEKARALGYGNVTEALTDLERMKAAEQPDHSGNAADMVHCACGDAYPASSFDAGFISGSGMCQNCDAAIPAKDIAASQPDPVKVPRELLSRHLDEIGEYAWDTYDEMRALLGKEDE